jgi:hypothetical protein
MRRTNLPTRPCRKTYGRHKDSKRTRLIHRPCGDIAPPVGGIHVSPAPSPGGTTSECSRETMIRGLHCSLFAMLSVIAVIHADRRRSCLRAVVPVFALFEYQLDGGMLGCPCRLLVGIVARAIWARGITRHLSGGGESSPLRGLLGDAVKTIEVEDAPRLTIEGSAGVGPSCAFLHERRDLRGSRSNTTTGQDRSGVGTPGRVGRPRNLFPSCPYK